MWVTSENPPVAEGATMGGFKGTERSGTGMRCNKPYPMPQPMLK